MSGDARLNILSRVRQAQIRAHIPETKSGLPAQLPHSVMDPATRLGKLQAEFDLLGVEVFVEFTEESVRNRVSSLITGQAILSWDADRLPYGMGECLEGEKVYYGTDSKDDQGKAEIGLTGCENAIAETGTIAMTSGPGRPRSASLMPMIHVVVIRATDIIPGMAQFFRMYREKADLPASGGNGSTLPYVVFITGPSRTADIELSLTLGVHGPGRVIAVIGP